MADQIYKVRDPSGALREISGPAGASDADIIAQAQKLFSAPTGGINVSSAKIETPRSYEENMLMKGPSVAEVPYEAGAKVNDWLAAKGAPASLAAGLGAATNAGLEGAQMLVGGGIGKMAEPAFQAAGRTMMQKALRPTLADQQSGKAERAITTMLEKGKFPTSGGVDSMRSKASQNDALVKELLAESDNTVNKQVVGNGLDPLISEVGKSPLPNADIATVRGAKKEFLNHPNLPKYTPAEAVPASVVESPILNSSGRPFATHIPESVIPASGTNEIPIQLAQELKQRAYKKLGDAGYGNGLKPAAERDSIKTIARILKEEIEAAVPAVKIPNADTTELLNAAKIAERRVMMSKNNNPIPLGASVATAVHNPAAALGLWANSSDLAKAALARALYSGKIPQTVGAAIPLAISESQDQQR